MNRPPLAFLAVGLSLLATGRADVTFEEKPDRVTVNINGSLFTEYRHGDAPNVYYWPLIGPGGAKMTRSFPMEKVEGEETDHKHHRSLWFSHGLVNGVDFWSDPPSAGGRAPKIPVGRTEHMKVLVMQPGKDSGVLKTSQKWIMPDGETALESVQLLRVYAGPETERMLDFEVTLKAGQKDVVFGDTKEGSAALRIAESMRFSQRKAPGLGHILNSEGATDDKVWGQHASWVSMSGPIEGRDYAITFMDHPSNLRHPSRWHARTYGLFAANPFAEASMDKTRPPASGNHTVKAGESLTLKYRILIAQGGVSGARQQERYEQYVKSVR